MEDKQIIQMYWNRDEEAIRQTDIKYRRILGSIASKILDNYEDARECLNDTYLKAWDSMPACWPDHLCAFLAKIIRNLAISRYNTAHAFRRQGNVYAVSLEELNDCVSGKDDVQQNLDAMELGEAISRYLKTVNPKHRILFVCRYFYFDSLKEAAKYAGMSENAAKAALCRMRKELKVYLENEERTAE